MNTSNTVRSLCLRLLWLAVPAALLAGPAWSQDCHYKVEAGDQMRYSIGQIVVPADCTDIEVTLANTGTQPARIMGHDWVLVKSSDLIAVANAARAAGFEHGWLPPADKRIIASTALVGGGESASVHIPSSALTPGVDYSFFCSAPGHYLLMKGRLIVDAGELAANTNSGH